MRKPTKKTAQAIRTKSNQSKRYTKLIAENPNDKQSMKTWLKGV